LLSTYSIHSGAQKVCIRHTGNLYRVLKRHKQTPASSFLDIHIKQILTQKLYSTVLDFVIFAARQNLCQGTLTRAIWAHQRVNLTRFDLQVYAFQDAFTVNGRFEVFDI